VLQIVPGVCLCVIFSSAVVDLKVVMQHVEDDSLDWIYITSCY